MSARRASAPEDALHEAAHACTVKVQQAASHPQSCERPAGTLPDAWRLPALQTLRVSGNGLTGTLPASWQAGMPNIRVLRLKFNKLRCALS